MTVSAYIINDPNVRLWNLTSRIRYERMLSRLGSEIFSIISTNFHPIIRFLLLEEIFYLMREYSPSS